MTTDNLMTRGQAIEMKYQLIMINHEGATETTSHPTKASVRSEIRTWDAKGMTARVYDFATGEELYDGKALGFSRAGEGKKMISKQQIDRDEDIAATIFELEAYGHEVREGMEIKVAQRPTKGMSARGESYPPASETVEARHIEAANAIWFGRVRV